jgi:Na+-translocating ferredoxin:NAD+ oxidoreductase RnfD subunit
LFNPAAFGIFLVTVLLGVQTQWKGTYSWHIIVPFGLYFIYRIRRLELLLGYFLASLLLFGIQATQQKVPLSNIFGYLSYFYIFIMMIEPKTTPFKLPGEIIFGICVAVLIFIFTQIGVRFDVELCALLIVNPFVHFLNKIPQRR